MIGASLTYSIYKDRRLKNLAVISMHWMYDYAIINQDFITDKIGRKTPCSRRAPSI